MLGTTTTTNASEKEEQSAFFTRTSTSRSSDENDDDDDDDLKRNTNDTKDLELPELVFGAASTSFAMTIDAVASGIDFVQKVTSTKKPSKRIRPDQISIARSRWDKTH